MIWVVDASVVIDLLLQMPTAPAIEERVFAPRAVITAPDLLQLETLQVLRRWRSRGALSSVRANEAFEDFCALDIRYYPHGPLLSRCWALKNSLTAYDAAYLALAEALGAKLLTKDAAFCATTTVVEVEQI